MDKESRKHQILQCACELFASQGFDATSVAQIAKQCSCSSPLVIRYFGSKDNIYSALLEQLREVCHQPLLTTIPEGSTMEKLESVYNTLVFDIQSLEETHAELLSALQSRGSAHDSRAEGMRCIQDVGIDILLPIIREGVEDGTFSPELPCEKAARIMWLYINGWYAIRSNYPKMKVLPFSTMKELLLDL